LLSWPLTSFQVEAVGFSDSTAGEFIKDVRHNSADLKKWVLPEELEISRRLDINYENVTNKFLISYELEFPADLALHNAQPLEQDYSLLTITAGDQTQRYYFLANYLISPVNYFSRGWTRIESKYFVFIVSDPDKFNEYSMAQLDDFVESTSERLGILDDRLRQLQKNKIYYYLCKTSEEIKNLTGYNTRGMYVLAYDYIVSTFNCHYHEITHLLVNYKLQHLPLLTHPFLQEGIAVALGGRGGKEPSVIHNMGIFLERSEFAGYRELLSHQGFASTDASLSYPVSGLYNNYILERLGGEKYLALYLAYSGDNFRADIKPDDLPPQKNWTEYLASYRSVQPINPAPDDNTNCETIYSDETAQICAGENNTVFRTKYAVMMGEEFLITSDNSEISVYDLRTNNLIAKYVVSFSRGQIPIRSVDGYRVFSIDNSVFGGIVEELEIRTVDLSSSGEQIPQ